MSGVSFTTAQDDENRLTSWTRTNGEDQSWALSLVGDWNSTAGQKLQGGTVYPFDGKSQVPADHFFSFVRNTPWHV